LHGQITEAERELQRTADELNREREKLAEAVKQLKVIEKLREKQKLRYDSAIRRQEQAGYDEAALQMHRQRRIA
jgi:flagellar export protein FliJ